MCTTCDIGAPPIGTKGNLIFFKLWKIKAWKHSERRSINSINWILLCRSFLWYFDSSISRGGTQKYYCKPRARTSLPPCVFVETITFNWCQSPCSIICRTQYLIRSINTRVRSVLRLVSVPVSLQMYSEPDVVRGTAMWWWRRHHLLSLTSGPVPVTRGHSVRWRQLAHGPYTPISQQHPPAPLLRLLGVSDGGGVGLTPAHIAVSLKSSRAGLVERDWPALF